MESIVLKQFDKLPKNGKCARNGNKQQFAILAGFILKNTDGKLLSDSFNAEAYRDNYISKCFDDDD